MYFYSFFVYWPPFHVFHINLDMMECFVKFPPPLYSCRTHHLALLKPPLPAKKPSTTITQYIHSPVHWPPKIWTSHSTHHTAICTSFTQHTMHSLTHSHTHTPLWQQGCWLEPKGMQEVQYGWGVGLCNCSLPASDRTDTSLRPILKCTKSLSAESLIRHECSATYQNWLQKPSRVWECVQGPTLPQQGQLATAGHNGTSLKMTSPKLKRKTKQKTHSESN